MPFDSATLTFTGQSSHQLGTSLPSLFTDIGALGSSDRGAALWAVLTAAADAYTARSRQPDVDPDATQAWDTVARAVIQAATTIPAAGNALPPGELERIRQYIATAAEYTGDVALAGQLRIYGLRSDVGPARTYPSPIPLPDAAYLADEYAYLLDARLAPKQRADILGHAVELAARSNDPSRTWDTLWRARHHLASDLQFNDPLIGADQTVETIGRVEEALATLSRTGFEEASLLLFPTLSPARHDLALERVREAALRAGHDLPGTTRQRLVDRLAGVWTDLGKTGDPALRSKVGHVINVLDHSRYTQLIGVAAPALG